MQQELAKHYKTGRKGTPYGEGLDDEALKVLIRLYQSGENPANIINMLPEDLKDGVGYQFTRYILNVEDEGQVWKDAPKTFVNGLLLGASIGGGEVIVGAMAAKKLSNFP